MWVEPLITQTAAGIPKPLFLDFSVSTKTYKQDKSYRTNIQFWKSLFC